MSDADADWALIRENVALLRQIRELKYQLKQAHKLLGKQGQTIYELRNEAAALRAERNLLRQKHLMTDERLSEHYHACAPTQLPVPAALEKSLIEGLA